MFNLKKYIIIIIIFLFSLTSCYSPFQSKNNSPSAQEKVLVSSTSESSSLKVLPLNDSDMIFVEGGTFEMGDANGEEDEKPVHKVKVNSFYISKTHVTQKEYQLMTHKKPSYFKGDNFPVDSVSWFDAIKFCNARSKSKGFPPAYNNSGDFIDDLGNITHDISKVKGYRLLTEAEWEFAAKGGNKSKGLKYSGTEDLNQINHCDSDCISIWRDKYKDGYKGTSPVGIYPPNEIGVYDMTGNLWEWVNDWYDSKYYEKSPENSPHNIVKSEQKVIRGGAWNSREKVLRVTFRDNIYPNNHENDIGFRIAKSIN